MSSLQLIRTLRVSLRTKGAFNYLNSTTHHVPIASPISATYQIMACSNCQEKGVGTSKNVTNPNEVNILRTGEGHSENATREEETKKNFDYKMNEADNERLRQQRTYADEMVEKGKKTAERIADKTKEKGEKAAEKIKGSKDEMAERTGSMAERTKENVEYAADKTKEGAKKIAEKTKETMGKMSEHGKDAMGGMAEKIKESASIIAHKVKEGASTVADTVKKTVHNVTHRTDEQKPTTGEDQTKPGEGEVKKPGQVSSP